MGFDASFYQNSLASLQVWGHHNKLSASRHLGGDKLTVLQGSKEGSPPFLRSAPPRIHTIPSRVVQPIKCTPRCEGQPAHGSAVAKHRLSQPFGRSDGHVRQGPQQPSKTCREKLNIAIQSLDGPRRLPVRAKSQAPGSGAGSQFSSARSSKEQNLFLPRVDETIFSTG